MLEAIISIISAVIVAIIGLLGTIHTNRSNYNKLNAELDKHNAVQDERITELTREVRLHNNFAERIPVIEQRITALEKNVYK
jgi:uncharacterized membrane protein YecN with MAPEG domain